MNQLVSPLNFARTSIPIYHYGPDDRITIEDGNVTRHLTVLKQTTEGSVFTDAEGRHHPYSHEQIYLMTVERRLKVERDYHSKEAANLSVKFGNLKITDFGEAKVRKALWLQELINEYIRFEAVGRKHPVLKQEGFRQRKVSLGVKCLTFLLPILKRIVSERWSGANGGVEVSYALPGPRHFKRLHDMYVDGGYDPLALVSLKKGPKSRTLSHQQDVELWLEYAGEYADRKRPSMRACFLRLQAEIARRNSELEGTGRRRYHMPSRKCFERLIKSMGVYYLMAKRYGEDHARKKFAIVHGGLALERPGQIVEMDEWKVNLSILLTHFRIWHLLTDEEKRAVERARVWVTVAIDRATKCILAMHFSRREPSHRSSLAALEMVVTDKTLISSVVGAGDPWVYGLVPESVCTDAGPAFVHEKFRAAVAALRCTQMFPRAGDAAARGTIESFFHTCELRFMDYFEGRTFSNILEKGKYDSQGYAVLNLDEFNRLFVRAIIDIYHNTPHSGLGFETPANAWFRLSKNCAVMQPIGDKSRRDIFGTELTRAITDKGVAVAGIHYNDTDLQRMRFEQQALPNSPAPLVEIRASRLDVSTISFKKGNDWIEAKATIGIPAGTTLFEWVGARKALADQHGANAEAKLSVLLACVRDLRAAGAAAATAAGLGVDVLLKKDYDAIDREHFKKPVVDDLKSRVYDLGPLNIPDNPLAVGIDAFDHLITSDGKEKEEPADDQVNEVLEDTAGSAFAVIDPTSDGDWDGIDFDDN
ncbi:integrase [Sinorhizobium terangae]|uniref:integrase n=1 Tax=Sinorhizobium terangae TaxID=110322 RepID=UPI0024B1FB00|nr:integrase [Sinorhizobium terangae]WFU49175.1 integrase [Sinorhizobium terangae]